jgi:hypothetical protein
MLHHANAPAQPTIIHATTESPLVALGIINLNGFEIGSSIKASNGVELTVHNG